jgi:glutamine amidotransferase
MRAVEAVGGIGSLVSNPSELKNFDRVILPGVGAFSKAMIELEKLGFVSEIKRIVENKVPLLGICLGMQMLFETSEEFGTHKGLGLLAGKIEKLDLGENSQGLKIPHVAWAPLNPPSSSKKFPAILDGVEIGSNVYFVHSFVANARNELETIAVTTYGETIVPAIVQKQKIYGCQFHPEKSGEVGLKIIKNFIYAD